MRDDITNSNTSEPAKMASESKMPQFNLMTGHTTDEPLAANRPAQAGGGY